ncbi:MAG: putative manganese-dependent inorganic diphosphatase [Eubacteriales bacterium]|nr:putative manganese-dependent inorganic diphosphatase [Eubacteriales bacterium]
MTESSKPVFVIGHKNPDTDSVCSAICYARLKSEITGNEYIAKRAGHLNEETQYVMNRSGVNPPQYIKDVRPQVKDIEIRRTQGVSDELSVRNAWKLMKSLDVVTLPITDKTKLKGLVTIGDVARSYFEIFDSNILSTAKTSFKNIVETLEGTVITGNKDEIYENGKVLIAAANPDMMENYIEENDLVILGNRYESQLCAIEMNAKCLIVCDGANVSMTIQKIAQEHNCIIIVTSYDPYTAARLINQSMPIRFFMKNTESLIKFQTNDFIEDIQDIMAKKRHRDFPIEDENGDYVGMISRRNLMGAGKKKVILVDHNEKNQAVYGIETTDILEIIDHHRLGAIQTMSPVFFRNQPLGCTATIIYKMYNENKVDIDKNTALLLCAAIISDTLIFKSPTCTEDDVEAGKALAAIAEIEPETFGKEMFKAGSNLSTKSPEDIMYQDYKCFTVNDVSIGVGQVNSMSEEEIKDLKRRLLPCIENAVGQGGNHMAFFMLTNIMTESSEVLCAGRNAAELLAGAFNVDIRDKCVILKGVVSRKKQLFPAIMEALQQ